LIDGGLHSEGVDVIESGFNCDLLACEIRFHEGKRGKTIDGISDIS